MNSPIPKVSILVPVYNVENYLNTCLDSLINQTLDDIEIICINDGSTDNSASILNEYQDKDKRIKVINKENTGYGASMNIGLEAATGKYIGIVESDDFADLKMFEDLYNLAEIHDADLAKSDYYCYYSNGNSVKKAGQTTKIKCNKVFSIKDNSKILSLVPSIWSSIYKRDFLNNNNIRFLETKGASYQDTSFAFKSLSSAKKIIVTPKAYLYYRCDNENSSVKQKDKVFCICNEYEEITKFLNEHLEIKELVNPIKLIVQFNAYRWNCVRIDKQFRDDFLERFQEDFKKYYENGEITQKVYKKISPSIVRMLVEDKTAFRKYIDKYVIKNNQKEKRRKQFSIKINSCGVSIILFGKQIVRIG